MATKIKGIIEYYSEHEVSEEVKDRVLERLAIVADEEEVNDAFLDLWKKADLAYMKEGDVDTAYNKLSTHTFNQVEKFKKFRIFNWARIAAVIVPLLLIVIFAKVYIQMSDNLAKSQSVAMLQTHTISNESKTLVLEDGTKIRLSQNSVLLYPSSFQGKERKVFLLGGASFDIKHDAKKPFHVSTSHFEITDLGTSFKVSSYSTDEEVSTTLKSGKIELRIIGEDKAFKMKPNDRLVYNVKTKEIHLAQVPTDDSTSWKTKKIDLNDVTIRDAAKILGKNYGVKFTFLTYRYLHTKITVHFNRGETLLGAMAIIKGVIPEMSYEIKGNEVIIK